MTTITRPTRRNADTLARWDAALDRATAKGLRLFQHDATGQWFCSGTDGQTVYAVTATTCECRASAEGDPVCQHRALYRESERLADQELGMTAAELETLIASATLPYDGAAIAAMLDAQVPTFDEVAAATATRLEGATVLVLSATGTMTELPDPAATPAAPRACTDCLDTGVVRMSTGWRLSDYVTAPCTCVAGRIAA